MQDVQPQPEPDTARPAQAVDLVANTNDQFTSGQQHDTIMDDQDDAVPPSTDDAAPQPKDTTAPLSDRVESKRPSDEMPIDNEKPDTSAYERAGKSTGDIEMQDRAAMRKKATLKRAALMIKKATLMMKRILKRTMKSRSRLTTFWNHVPICGTRGPGQTGGMRRSSTT